MTEMLRYAVEVVALQNRPCEFRNGSLVRPLATLLGKKMYHVEAETLDNARVLAEEQARRDFPEATRVRAEFDMPTTALQWSATPPKSSVRVECVIAVVYAQNDVRYETRLLMERAEVLYARAHTTKDAAEQDARILWSRIGTRQT